MLTVSDLPAVNAILNGTSAILLALGYSFIRIRRRKWKAHRACMLAAFGVSTLFLISYVIYHVQVGSVPFQGQGWVRPVYFTVLGSHLFLAISMVPLVLVTLARALQGRFTRHRRIARWTLPLWFYVSVSGIVVYLMLYHLYPVSSR